ncbi:MAG: MarR family transcriptional regulator [Anaerolineaceae bacterium]|nr:MarR family transcriptional regulator [Anaerolineaceae bacterium]
MLESNLEQDVNLMWTLLFTIVLDGEKRMATLLATYALTPPQFYVLKTLVERGGSCPIGEIAHEHHLTNATMSGLVKRMESMKPPLVVREPSTLDRRSVNVVLTAGGQERFIAVQMDLMSQLRQVLQLLTPDERQDLIHYLSRYAMMISEQFAIVPTPDG